MNYNKIYDNIISRAKERGAMNAYTEKHHIIPRCMGGNDDKINLAVLTPEEHFVCHLLLLKMYPDNKKLAYAIRVMCGESAPTNKRNNKLYGWLKRRIYRNKTVKTCSTCGNNFSISFCSLKKQFCSKKCHDINQRKSRIKKICKTCNMIFYAPLSKNLKQFCSIDCSAKDREIKIIKTCLVCNRQFKVLPSMSFIKCCSRACADTNKIKKIIKTCPLCNTQFQVVPSKKKIFCSRSCSKRKHIQ